MRGKRHSATIFVLGSDHVPLARSRRAWVRTRESVRKLYRRGPSGSPGDANIFITQHYALRLDIGVPDELGY